MPKISIGDCSLNYEEQGSGEPLLLVPGLGGAYAGFAPIVPALSKHFRVIMHDHRGTGGSDKTLMTYSVDQMADDVIKLMDASRSTARTIWATPPAARWGRRWRSSSPRG